MFDSHCRRSSLPLAGLIVPLVAAIVGGATLTACDRAESPRESVIRLVRTVQVSSHAGARGRTFSGTARAGVESALSFRIPGAIKTLRVKVGDRVKKGQVIATLDDQDYRLQLRESQAGLGQAVAQARNAKADYERVRKLYENRTISLKELDAARATSDSARATVGVARQRVQLARSQLGYCTITAPLDGDIAEVPIEVNENVQAQQMVAKLNSHGLPEVHIAVPESLIVRITQGAQATVVFDAIDGHTFAAQVTKVGVASTGGTTFPVTVRLTEASESVRAGMAANVTIAFAKSGQRERIYVPAHSVLEDGKGRFTYLARGKAGATGTIERRAVKTGSLTGEGLEVLEGLADGDLVVVAGLRFVEPKMKVRILVDE